MSGLYLARRGSFHFRQLHRFWYSSLSTHSCPFGLNFHSCIPVFRIVAEAAPLPILRPLHQSTRHGIAMNIAQLLHKLRMIANVAIIITPLPEPSSTMVARHADFNRQNCIAQQAPLRFAQQQVDVFRHQEVSIDAQSTLTTDTFQRSEKIVAEVFIRQTRLTAITTESNEVRLPGLLKAYQSLRHGGDDNEAVVTGQWLSFPTSGQKQARHGAPYF